MEFLIWKLKQKKNIWKNVAAQTHKLFWVPKTSETSKNGGRDGLWTGAALF